MSSNLNLRGTTILAVRHNGRVAVGGDGQVTLGATVMKHTANKVRRMYNNKIIGVWSGSLVSRTT